MSCTLCEKLNTDFHNFDETLTIHSMTPIFQLFQKILGSSVNGDSICNGRLCGTCYDDFNEFDFMEQKLKSMVKDFRKRYSKSSRTRDKIIISSEDRGEIYTIISVNENDEYLDYHNEMNYASDSSDSPKTHPKEEKSDNDERRSKDANKKIHFSDQQELKNILNLKFKSEENSEDSEDKTEENNVNVLYDMMDEKNSEMFPEPQSPLEKVFDYPKKSYNCSKCDLSFSTQKELKSHSTKHGEEKPFVCEVCGKVYRSKNAFDIHVGMHNGIYPYKCLRCDKIFTQKGAMVRHNKIHTGEKPYQCEECGKCFTHHTSFTIHKISHTGEKAYKCNICGLMLNSTSHLNRHMRVHTGEKRYSCPTCGKRFAEKYNLVSHSKIHNMSSPVTGAKKKFRCKMCSVVFHKRLHLEDHIAKVHSTDDNYVYMIVDEDQDSQK